MARGPGEDLKEPDFIGPAGRAWEVEMTADGLTRPDQAAALGMWLIEAPMVAPFFNYYGAGLIHLRDISGGMPAVELRKGATHEFHILALDPRFDDFYDPNDMTSLQHPVMPPNVGEQLIVPGDEQALAIAREGIEKCLNGELPPDSDYRDDWHNFLMEAEQGQ
jgi:hypothetical protein